MGNRVPNTLGTTRSPAPKSACREQKNAPNSPNFDAKETWERLARAGVVDPSDAVCAIGELSTAEKAREKNTAEQGRARRISARRRQKGIDSDSKAYSEHCVDSILRTTKKLETRRAQETRAKRGQRPNRAVRIAKHHKARAENAKRNRERQRRSKRRMHKHLGEFRQSLQVAGQSDARPVGIPAKVWRFAQLCGDSKHYSLAERQRTLRIGLAQMPKTAAQRLRQAAFHPEPYQATRQSRGRTLHQCERTSLPERTWDHPLALDTLLLGLLIWQLGEHTKRQGFQKVVRGYGRGVFAALLQDWTTGKHASVHHVCGASREVPGPLLGLLQAGFLHRNQPPADVVSPRDRGPSGWAYNVYWVFSVDDPAQGFLLFSDEALDPNALERVVQNLEALEPDPPF